ncbi:hypothetical protein RRG08_044473 [Elysia crispata]|uniref:Uncharacterized protein n=1 Tax=Elysia crispata TaxID=231223 RepID=A0AAE1D7S9_9GAST|nr:hypothetical protein RRG08_044473 [Elysia crispata]
MFCKILPATRLRHSQPLNSSGEAANDKSHVENKGTTIFNKSNQSNEVLISGGKFWQITLIADAMGNRLALERTATATLLNDGYSRVKPIRRLIKDQRNMYIIPDAIPRSSQKVDESEDWCETPGM